MLLSSADALLLGENGDQVRRADSTTDWPSFNILVRPQFKSSPDVNYTMEAIPVGSEGSKMLYDISAKFDKNSESGMDKSIASYMQTGGYATVIDTSNAKEASVCLDSESGPYPIVPINAIAQRLMDIRIEDAVEVPGCSAQFRLADSNIACKGSDGASFTILGGDMNLKVTYNPNEEVSGNGGSQSACAEVVKPVSVQETHGKTFLKP